ncbi:S41 family peptidase [Sedimenticola selenatireducens]|uniref:Tail specific protease domain-containing protein n=1 Tax=Sedimenticola selenatireducens TaxID=191960 RepID=A0A2N6CYH5_9GAMM|nr:S41 family peptidase [Sedimenticola selenatireducens]PLX62372.1 MAG: hypothetical protein C0630_05835 [Sedimenticola selenatireducens]
MKSRLRYLVTLLGLVWSLPLVATEARVVEEVRAILLSQALSVPNESQLQSLAQEDLGSSVKTIDPWAHLVPPGNVAESRAVIGAELYKIGQRTWLMPYMNGPLARAGIRDRVELYKVNSKEVAVLSLPDIARMLTGSTGDVLQIEICESACRSPSTLTLVLEDTPVPAVEAVELAGQRIIRVRSFRQQETKIFLATLVSATTDSSPLILDLRDCQGGDLFEAMDSAALFLPAGQELAVTYDRHGLKRRFYSPQTPPKFARPLTIWISEVTASAGEIFAGILQQQGRARLAGMRSRGKCVSQTKKRLSDGSLFYFTNLEIRLPGGVGCKDVGIEPDITLGVEELRSSRLILDRLQPSGVQ